MTPGLPPGARDRHDAAVRLAALLLTAFTAAVLLVPTLPLSPAAAGASASTGAGLGLGAGPVATGVSPVEQRLANRVNRVRAQHGCGALQHRAALHGTARTHSALMARHRRLAHQLPGEATLSSRLAGAGYPASRRMGEVIAAGAMGPKRVVRMWLGSPSHRRLLLDCRFRQMGVGIAESAPGQRWWTVDLVR